MQNNNSISLFFLILLIPSSLFALPEHGEIVTQRGTVDDAYYAGGGTIDINASISGDFVVAGSELFIGHHIKGELIAIARRQLFRQFSAGA